MEAKSCISFMIVPHFSWDLSLEPLSGWQNPSVLGNPYPHGARRSSQGRHHSLALQHSLCTSIWSGRLRLWMPPVTVSAPHQYDPESSLHMAVIWRSGDPLQFEITTPSSLKNPKRSGVSGRSSGSRVPQVRFTGFPSIGWESVTSSFGRENSSREKSETKLSVWGRLGFLVPENFRHPTRQTYWSLYHIFLPQDYLSSITPLPLPLRGLRS